MSVSFSIKRLRKSLLLSQNDFAERIGVSYSAVNRWENEKAVPNYKALKKIEQFCRDNSIDFNLNNFMEEK